MVMSYWISYSTKGLDGCLAIEVCEREGGVKCERGEIQRKERKKCYKSRRECEISNFLGPVR